MFLVWVNGKDLVFDLLDAYVSKLFTVASVGPEIG